MCTSAATKGRAQNVAWHASGSGNNRHQLLHVICKFSILTFSDLGMMGIRKGGLTATGGRGGGERVRFTYEYYWNRYKRQQKGRRQSQSRTNVIQESPSPPTSSSFESIKPVWVYDCGYSYMYICIHFWVCLSLSQPYSLGIHLPPLMLHLIDHSPGQAAPKSWGKKFHEFDYMISNSHRPYWMDNPLFFPGH